MCKLYTVLSLSKTTVTLYLLTTCANQSQASGSLCLNGMYLKHGIPGMLYFYSYVGISLNIYMKFSRQTTKINSSVISMIVNGDVIITIVDLLS